MKLLVRPEHMHFGEVGLPAIVQQSLFMGASKLVDVRLETNQSMIRVQLAGHEPSPEPGSRVSVTFDESRALIDA